MATAMISESWLMRFFRSFGMDSIAWSLRRLHCPVRPDDLVLEVGSGGNPYSRANVLVDAYESTRERHWVPLKVDRPMVLGFAERLPFKDKAFDFVIASHVLEHSAHPEKFISELMRVGKAGYIEVPDAFMERLIPYLDHRLEITNKGQKLLIRKKSKWKNDPDTVELFENKLDSIIAGKVIPKYPFEFHVRYYWKETIDFEILNPAVDCTWDPPVVQADAPLIRPGVKARIKSAILNTMRGVFSQKKRNNSIELEKLLRCISCGSDIKMTAASLDCTSCNQSYPVRSGIPVMYAELV